MRTALVRLDAITTLLTRERIAHRMEAVLAQTSPEALVEAYTVDLLNANPRIENECGTLIYTYWEMHQAIGEWPTPAPSPSSASTPPTAASGPATSSETGAPPAAGCSTAAGPSRSTPSSWTSCWTAWARAPWA
ncbi:hypothetical protein ACFQXA_38830 [Nocardiopsis composta]